MRSFKSQVLSVVRSIPAGRVATYGDVARLAGRTGAARAVGNIMRECGDASVPCHRVIAAGGRLGGYGGNELLKAQLLRAEGLRVSGSRVRDFARARWGLARVVTRRRTRSPVHSSHLGSPPGRRRAAGE
jgi:O-6-methylguanine DNA methyltransferase